MERRQIIPPIDAEISAAIDRVRDIPMSGAGIEEIDESILERYYDEVLTYRRHPGMRSDLKIVATPLHGVGGRYLREIFDRAGFRGFTLVPEQAEPDGEFPTVEFPNPEEPGALDLAIEHATRTHAGLILANDPDADRLGVALPVDDGWQALTGNEIGCLLAWWLMTEGTPPPNPLLMTTIVSSRMLSRMAAALGARYDETLTGFKWIAHKSHEHFGRDGSELVLGYEEALGYTVGRTVADKDGISAALIFAEMAAVLEARGQTVAQLLEQLYREYGLHRSLQHSIVKPGTSGAAEIRKIMDRLRANPPQLIAGARVAQTLDWAEGLDGLPASNVLGFALEGGGRILVRPSGTEPKIKFYLETVVEIESGMADARALADAGLQRLLAAILELCGVDPGMSDPDFLDMAGVSSGPGRRGDPLDPL